MPSWVKDHESWAKAKRLAEKQDKSGDYAYVTGIYKRMVDHKKSLEDIWENHLEDIEEYKKSAPEHIQLLPPPVIYLLMKAEHIDDAKKKRIANMYRSNPGKWSVRSLADHLGVTRHQVGEVVKNLPKSTKTEEQTKKKQSNNARWKGKKLPKHIVEANHTGRNKAIAARPATSMEKPIAKHLNELGIAYKTQVEVRTLVGSGDAESGIVDFYIPSKKIVIQADGGRHRLKNVAARIKKQDSALRKAGYKVVHVSDVEMSRGEMKNILGSALGK